MSSVRLARTFALLAVTLLCACGGGGGSDDGPTIPTPADGLQSFTLPGYPHAIDVYGVGDADRAVVILHGAGGRNYGIAHDLGLNGNEGAPPTAASIDFERLRERHVIAVFPQGQAKAGNAHTWSNRVMDSGQDDMAFLSALATYIRTQYGISQVYLMGHSNGAMMANRFWCESAATFDAYIAIAGPASAYFLTHACAPSVKRPYYGIVGNADAVIGAAGNWDAQTWTINKVLVGVTAEGAYVDPTMIGEWEQHKRHANAVCATTPALAQGALVGNVVTWLDCSGTLKVQRILTADHKIASLEDASGFSLFDAAIDFIDSVD